MPLYNPGGIDVNSLIPWLRNVFAAMAANESGIQNAMQSGTLRNLNYSIFGRDLRDPFSTGEETPFYAFRHLSLSPGDRQNLYNQVVGSNNAYDQLIKNMGMEFFALNPDDINYYWNAGLPYSASGFDPTQGHYDSATGQFVPGGPPLPFPGTQTAAPGAGAAPYTYGEPQTPPLTNAQRRRAAARGFTVV